MTTAVATAAAEAEGQARRRGAWRHYPRSIDDVYVFAAIAVVAAAALLTSVGPHDFWWHLANGRAIVVEGSFPTVDSFTWTQSGEPFFNQMWLAQVVLLTLYRGGGVPLVIAGHAAVIIVAYVILLRLCVRLGGSRRLAAVILLTAVLPLSFTNWAVRPQPYAFPLFAVFLATLWDAGLESRSAKPPRVWPLPLVMAVWVNVHGSFPLGLGLYGILLVAMWLRVDRVDRSERRRLTLWAVPTFLAVLANPRGVEVFAYVRNLLTSPSVTDQVVEWRPTGLYHASGWIYFALVGVVIVVLTYSRSRPPVRHVLVGVVFLLLGFLAMRNTIWAAVVAAPLLAQQLHGRLVDRQASSRPDPVGRVIVVALVLLVALASPWVRPSALSGDLAATVVDTPVEAVAFLEGLPKAQRPNRLYNELGYGSYIAYAAPQLRTFFDPRFELFPTDQIEDAVALDDARFADEIISSYGFDGFILSRSVQRPLIEHLRASSRWQLAHEDLEAVVFLPRN